MKTFKTNFRFFTTLTKKKELHILVASLIIKITFILSTSSFLFNFTYKTKPTNKFIINVGKKLLLKKRTFRLLEKSLNLNLGQYFFFCELIFHLGNNVDKQHNFYERTYENSNGDIVFF